MEKNGLKLGAKIHLYTGPSEGRAQLLGFADLFIGGSWIIKDIRIVRAAGKDGEEVTFISFPQRKAKDRDEWFGVAHPMSPEVHKQATELILAEYGKAAKAA